MKTLRYKQQGVYDVEVNNYMSNNDHRFNLSVKFSTEPSQADKLKELAKGEIENFLNNGPASQSLSQAKEYLLNKNKTSLKDNSYWVSLILFQRYLFNSDFITGYDTILMSLQRI